MNSCVYGVWLQYYDKGFRIKRPTRVNPEPNLNPAPAPGRPVWKFDGKKSGTKKNREKR